MKRPPKFSLFSIGVLWMLYCGALFAADRVEEDPQPAKEEKQVWQKLAARMEEARKAKKKPLATLSVLLGGGKVTDPNPDDPASDARAEDAAVLKEYRTAKANYLKAKAEIEVSEQAQLLLEMTEELAAFTRSAAERRDILLGFFDDQTIADPNPDNGASKVRIAPGAKVDDAEAHLKAYIEAKAAYLNAREFKALFEKQFYAKRAQWRKNRVSQTSDK